MSGNLPHYRLKILNKKSNTKNPNAGAGWINKDGSISLILNPAVILTESENLIYMLFLNDYKEESNV